MLESLESKLENERKRSPEEEEPNRKEPGKCYKLSYKLKKQKNPCSLVSLHKHFDTAFDEQGIYTLVKHLKAITHTNISKINTSMYYVVKTLGEGNKPYP
jgi:hypothetical protein